MMKSNPDKTILTLILGFGVLYLFTDQVFWVYTMIALAGIAVFFPFLAKKIEWVWFKIAELLGAVVPKVLLTIVFYGLLFPIALMRRWLTKKDPLMIRRKYSTSFRQVNKKFSKEDLINPW